MMDECRAKDNSQESQIAQALEAPVLVGSFHFSDDLWCSKEIQLVHDEEHRQQDADRGQPDGPAVGRHPPERDALEKAKKEWRVAYGSEAPADVGDKEDEEDNVVGGQAVFVHPQ